jgi:hypothetical protein
MRRLKVLVLAFSALCAVAALTAGSAFAELPQLLTAGGSTVTAETYTGESGATALRTLGGSEVECKKSTAEGELSREATSKGYLGPFHIHFRECKGPLGSTCTGATDAEGTILVLGEAHLVYDSLTTLGVGVLFLVAQFHFTCTLFGVNELILVKGSVICLIKPINTVAKHFEIVCEESATHSGDPKEPHYWNASGVEQTASLESNVGEKETFESSSQRGTGLILTALEVKIDG